MYNKYWLLGVDSVCILHHGPGSLQKITESQKISTGKTFVRSRYVDLSFSVCCSSNSFQSFFGN